MASAFLFARELCVGIMRKHSAGVLFDMVITYVIVAIRILSAFSLSELSYPVIEQRSTESAVGLYPISNARR